MQTIPYNQIPKQPPIFVDAVHDFLKVSEFFNGDFRDPLSFRNVWEAVQTVPFRRQEVANVLVREQVQHGAPEEAIRNAELLAESDCAAVLTGQQIGMLGGPLYTVIKAQAAVQWAERLSDILGISVVPIFWMEGEDHDFQEIRKVNVLDREGSLVSAELDDTRTDSHQVVGWHLPDSSLNQFMERLEDVLPQGLHREDVLNRINECYHPDVTLSEAFGRWLSGWLGKQGLVVTESLNPDMKRLAASCFQKAVSRSDVIAKLFEERARELQTAGYSITLKSNPAFHFFYILQDGVRVPVHRENAPKELSHEQLLKLTDSHPERFSPKAVLRPIVQDTLYPTIAIIAGAGEISYYPQVQPLYQDFQRPMPVIVPRPGITLVEKNWNRKLRKLSLSVSDLLQPQDSLNKKSITSNNSRFLDSLDDKKHQVSETLGSLVSYIADNYPDQEQPAHKLQQDVDARIQRFIQGLQDTLVKQNQATMEGIQQLRTALYPGDRLQERGLSPLNFLVRHGFEWVTERLRSVPIDQFEHCVIPMEEE